MRNPFTTSPLRKLKAQLEAGQNRPYIGVTQGGSSREWRGAKVAATKANYKEPKKEKFYVAEDED